MEKGSGVRDKENRGFEDRGRGEEVLGIGVMWAEARDIGQLAEPGVEAM